MPVPFICEMAKDSLTQAIKLLIENGQVRTFGEIFERYQFPVSRISNHLGTNFIRLKKHIKNATLFSFADAIKIAAYFDVPEKAIIDLIYAQVTEDRKRKKKG